MSTYDIFYIYITLNDVNNRTMQIIFKSVLIAFRKSQCTYVYVMCRSVIVCCIAPQWIRYGLNYGRRETRAAEEQGENGKCVSPSCEPNSSWTEYDHR